MHPRLAKGVNVRSPVSGYERVRTVSLVALNSSKEVHISEPQFRDPGADSLQS